MFRKTAINIITASALLLPPITSIAADDFTLIHSAWLGGWQWQHVEAMLGEDGSTTHAPDLPGHGADKTPTSEITLQSYVDRVVSVLDKNTTPTVLVGHSFGGIVASQVAEARPDKVKAIVYLCAFLLPDQVSFNDAVQGVGNSTVLNNLVFNDDKTLVGVKESVLHEAVGADVPVDAFNGAKQYLVLEPTQPLGEKLSLSDERYGSIPRYYVKCTNDNAIPPAVQAAMISNLPVQKTYSVEASHLPVFSKPQEVTDILRDVAAREQTRVDANDTAQAWAKAFNSGDAVAATAFYEADAVMNARPFGTYKGTTEILAFWTKLIADGAKEMRYINPMVNVLDANRATITSRWDMNIAGGIIHKELWVRQADGSIKLKEDDFEVLQ